MARPGPGSGMPNRAGHFDDIAVDDPTFPLAHAYAAVRLALDVWEGYLGRRIPWHFAAQQAWLEIGLVPTYDNAESGWGWLELGADLGTGHSQQLYATNLDVVTHEVGHLIIHSVVGLARDQAPGEFAGFHEAAADFIALLVSANLDPVVDQVLRETRGNLYVANELNRLGELTSNTQIRLCCNDAKMSEFALGWSNEHDLSEPLSGALFDLLVDVYQRHLVDRGLIPASLAGMVEEVGHLRAFAPRIQAGCAASGELTASAKPCSTRAIVSAATSLSRCRLQPDRFSYSMVQHALEQADLELDGGKFGHDIAVDFAWREIGRIEPGSYLGGLRGTNALTFGLHRCAKRSELGG